mmetsp:Transcript_53572/g.60951  ORF Transcript_53572/g.60951 Transcript_53572/m.60951 type:complete len:87 (+) Transcript_53572:437-697(+)
MVAIAFAIAIAIAIVGFCSSLSAFSPTTEQYKGGAMDRYVSQVFVPVALFFRIVCVPSLTIFGFGSRHVCCYYDAIILWAGKMLER